MVRRTIGGIGGRRQALTDPMILPAQRRPGDDALPSLVPRQCRHWMGEILCLDRGMRSRNIEIAGCGLGHGVEPFERFARPPLAAQAA